MIGYKCDICGDFIPKPIEHKQMYNIQIGDIQDVYEASLFVGQICDGCMQAIMQFILERQIYFNKFNT